MEMATSNLYSDQVKLAKALVHPDKAQRERTYDDLIAFVANAKSDTFTELEMLKLWKALYYCLWLADKPDVQGEVVAFLCSLFPRFKEESLVVLCVRMLYRTILREWQYLDQYRIEKIYRLIRTMVRETFAYLHNKKWQEQLTNSFISALDEEILQKTPNGVRFQCADVFLDELHNATDGKIQTAQFLTCAKPFLRCATSARTDAIFRERVTSAIFEKFANQYAREHAATEATETPVKVFVNVSTKVLQGTIFELASSESDTGCRKRLYGLHSLFPSVTGEAFVDLGNVSETATKPKEASAGKRKNAPVSEEVSVDTEKKGKKSKTSEAPVSVEEPAAVVADTSKGKSKKGKKATEVEMPVVDEAPVVEVPVEETGKSKRGKKAQAPVEVEEPKEKPKKKKQSEPVEADEVDSMPTRKSVRFDKKLVSYQPSKAEAPAEVKSSLKRGKK
jgi:ribosomal RNA-processing protein 1